MATTVAILEAKLRADNRDFNRDIDRSESKMKRFGGVAKAAALGAGAGIAYGLGKVAKIGWDEFNEGQRVAAQTNAVLKSTGGVANVAAKDVQRLSEALMRKSGVDDEVIARGQNMLLTFKQIRNEAGQGNDIFNQATKATLDLSVAMGTDMSKSAIMVGKALNDPVKGITAMRRVGIQFTAAQEDQIKKMVKAGDVMGAQKLILKELESQFGGSAEAAGKTFGGQIDILRERFNNWSGEMVGKAIPVLQRFGQWLMPIVEKAVRVVGDIIESHVKPAVQSLAETIRRHEPELREIWENVTKIIRTMWKVAGPILSFLFEQVVPRVLGVAIKWVGLYTDAFLTIIETGQRVAKWFRRDFVNFWKGAWQKAQDIFFDAKTWILDTFLGFADRFLWLAGKAFGWIPGVGDDLEGIRDKIRRMRDEARLAAARRYAIRFVTNAAQVKSNIEDMRGSLPGRRGDVRYLDIAPSRAMSGVNSRLFGALGLAQQMGMSVTSTYRPGATVAGSGGRSDHSYYPSKAVDFGGTASQMRRFAQAVTRLSGIDTVIHSPLGLWRGGSWGPIASAITRATHFNHVHVDTFDKGGWLPPRSATLAINRTNQWEPVGPPGRGGGLTINVPAGAVIVDGEKLMRLIEQASRLSGRRGGPRLSFGGA